MNKTITETAKQMIVLLRRKEGCTGFNELIHQIRDHVFKGIYTYEQIGVTEIKLTELGLNNARLRCVQDSPSIFADQCIAQQYSRELARLRGAKQATARVV